MDALALQKEAPLPSSMLGLEDGPQLTILSVAYPLLPVSAGAGGGAEQILYILDRNLVKAGHRSLVIAAEGSSVSGELLATPAARGEITDATRRHAQAEHRAALEHALRNHKIDLVHFHGLDFHAYVPANPSTPELVTLHLPIDWYPASIFDDKGRQFLCVSASQARSRPVSSRLPVIPNGIDIETFRPSKSARSDSLLWLGRICPEKGLVIALRVAHKLDLRLTIAGPVHPFEAHRKYFEQEVTPLLDQKRFYLGPVDLEEKATLLQRASCLLIPSLVSETSSLVAMEAISSGTPVVAFRSGALPEIVEHGRTGLIVDSEEEMARGVLAATAISAGVCRRSAEARFDSRRMVSDYLRVYHRSAARSVSPAE